MRKIFVTCITNTVGTDGHHYLLVDDTTSTDELDRIAYDLALNNAEMYDIYPTPNEYSSDEEEDSEWCDDEYDDNIEGYWQDYIPEKHDGYQPGGGDPVWEDYTS